jgi:hypothetical protein
MSQSALNLIGCASFSAIVLISVSVQAEPTANSTNSTTKPAASGYVEFSAAEPQPTQADCSCQNPQLDPNSDPVGDLAIEQYGCDCAGCRNLTMQRMQIGTL